MNGKGFTANPENLMDKGNRIIKLFERYEELLRNAKKVGDEITSIWNGSDATSYNASLKGYLNSNRTLILPKNSSKYVSLIGGDSAPYNMLGGFSISGKYIIFEILSFDISAVCFKQHQS